MDRLTEAVEALARAMGWWREDLDNRRGEWSIEVNEEPELGGAYTIRRWELVSGSARRSAKAWRVTPIEGMLVLRCALLGTTRVRCPDCHGVGDITVGDHGDADNVACPACTGPAVVCPGRCAGIMGRDCIPCGGGNTPGWLPGKPTGHVDRSWAEVLLGAMPRECGACLGRVVVGRYDDGEAVECGACDGGSTPGDHEARAKISVKADELAERGQPGCSTCKGSQFEKTGTVLGFLATGTLDAWKRRNPASEGWTVWSQPERGVMIGGGDGVRIVCRRPCPSCASSRRLGLWVALWLARSPCDFCGGEDQLGLGPGMVWDSTGRAVEHRGCAGSGRALGSHTAAMAEAGRALVEELDRAAVK